MKQKTRIAIVGYGNVGRGVENAIKKNEKLHGDMNLVAILSRSPERVLAELDGKYHVPVLPIDLFSKLVDEVDVAVLCGGSKKDLPHQGPFFAKYFNTIDSFDTHAHIGPWYDKKTKKMMDGYRADVNAAAKPTGHTSAISIGWDPGTFSIERVLANSFLPGVKAWGFYGLGKKGGLSMGHSDAVRQIEGVVDARQYTHAIHEAIERVRSGENPDLKPGDMHWRECFVVAEGCADKERVEKEIKEMPNYFAPYRTEVYFVTQEELDKEHAEQFHDGLVIAVGETSPGKKAIIEYRCQWDSNPEATGSIMAAHARAIHRLNREGVIGVLRPIDVPASYLSPHNDYKLDRELM